MSQPLLIYDGVCKLCNGVVKFIVKRDPEKKFKFCALQSAAAQPFLAQAGISPEDALKSFVLVRRDGTVARRSDAALEIAAELSWPWPTLGAVCWIVPRFVRDAVYGLVAVNRYALFGRAEEGECLIPSASILSRMLDADEIRASMRRDRKVQ